MRLSPFLIALLFLIGAVGTQPSRAQSTTPSFKPEISETGQQFQDIAEAAGQRTNVDYLHPDSDPKLRKPGEQQDIANFRTTDPRLKALAAIVLILLIAVLIWVWMRNSAGGGLFARGIKDDNSQNGGTSGAANSDVIGSEERLSLADIASIENPREAVRRLMISALLSAASENKIPLRRSLTTRDVLHQVPVSWQPKPILQELVGRTELVLFGGRTIDHQQFADLLEFSKPLFGRTGR